MADGRWLMTYGRWPMADDQWPMADLLEFLGHRPSAILPRLSARADDQDAAGLADQPLERGHVARVHDLEEDPVQVCLQLLREPFPRGEYAWPRRDDRDRGGCPCRVVSGRCSVLPPPPGRRRLGGQRPSLCFSANAGE